MGVTVRVTVGDEQVGQALLDVRLRAGDLTDPMKRIAAYGVSSTLGRFRDQAGPDGTPWPASRRGGKTLRDSGRLAASIAGRSDARSAVWGTNLAYAAVHQFGGTIRPRDARALAIPIHPSAQGRSPREWPDGELTLIARPGRPPLLVRVIGGEGSRARRRWVLMYVLVRSVTLPARPFLGLSDGDVAVIVDALGDHVLPADGSGSN